MTPRGLWPAVLCLAMSACAAPASSSDAAAASAASSAVPASPTPSLPSLTATASPTSTATATAAAATEEPSVGPGDVVQAFYDWYLTDQDYNHLLARPELAPEFVEWLQNFSWEYNAIVCAQELPDWVLAEETAVEGPRALVPTTVSFFGSPGAPGPSVDLTFGPNGWQILHVNCED